MQTPDIVAKNPSIVLILQRWSPQASMHGTCLQADGALTQVMTWRRPAVEEVVRGQCLRLRPMPGAAVGHSTARPDTMLTVGEHTARGSVLLQANARVRPLLRWRLGREPRRLWR